MNVRVRRLLALSSLALLAASAACAGRGDDEREARLASAMKNIGGGGDPGPTDPPDPSDPPGGGGGHHPLRDAGVKDSAPPVGPSLDPDAAPPIAGTCATRRYFVWRADLYAGCPEVSAAGGTWTGESIFPGHATNHCAYVWTGPSFPDPVALDALSAVALSLHVRPVVPDCTTLPGACTPDDTSCAAPAPALGPGECPPSEVDGGRPPGGMTTCDSCAIADKGVLYAVIAPNLVSAPTLVGTDERRTTTFTFTPPPGAQRFAIPIPTDTLEEGAIVSFDAPQP